MGDAPNLVERFLTDRKISGHKTLKQHFNEFLEWLKEGGGI